MKGGRNFDEKQNKTKNPVLRFLTSILTLRSPVHRLSPVYTGVVLNVVFCFFIMAHWRWLTPARTSVN